MYEPLFDLRRITKQNTYTHANNTKLPGSVVVAVGLRARKSQQSERILPAEVRSKYTWDESFVYVRTTLSVLSIKYAQARTKCAREVITSSSIYLRSSLSSRCEDFQIAK